MFFIGEWYHHVFLTNKVEIHSETGSLVYGAILKCESQTLKRFEIINNILIFIEKVNGQCSSGVHSNRSLIVGTIIQRLSDNGQSRQYIFKSDKKRLNLFITIARYDLFYF